MKYLIDANLPKEMDAWETDTIHATEIEQDASDDFLWNYAIQNNLIIVTKDFDFSNRIAGVKPPPRIIHFRLGNIKYRELNLFLNANWITISLLSAANKLVVVYRNKIETVE